MPVVWVGFGLVLLVVGAELLVRGGAQIATRLGIPPMVVGLTVVSVGTSFPELAIGIDATLRDAGPLAVGNIAGTNIVNLLLILGLSAAMVPLAISTRTIRFELPIIATVSVLLVLLALDGELSRLDGLLLLATAVAYTLAVVRLAIADSRERSEQDATSDESLTRQILMVGTGLGLVAVGADWLVQGSVDLASSLGISEVVIGLTIVAIGSSAPELVTTLVSTVRGERDIAIGNLIGSSIYNITFILGVTALVRPLGVTSELIRVDLPLMAFVALLLIPVFITGRRVSRAEGISFVLAYLAYLGTIVALRS
ncbi:MAG TPA: calcium/sodium antiporter [Aeromicrobium sp.]|nr:calcium/sodium antiporter [Aeromicrobium sp.]